LFTQATFSFDRNSAKMPDQQVLLETAQAKVPLQSLFLTRILLQYLMTFDVLCLAYASRFSY